MENSKTNLICSTADLRTVKKETLESSKGLDVTITVCSIPPAIETIIA